MCEDLLGENLQELVTLGYGIEMEKRGIDKGKNEEREKFKEALDASRISPEERKKIM